MGSKLAPMLIIGYWITSVLGHLRVSLWLVQQRESDLLGAYKLADFLPHAGALLLAAVMIWQIRRAWHGSNRAITLAAWTAWLVAVVLVDRFLIYSFPEYLHYPQYALLAWMSARFVDPDRTAFAVGPILLAVTVLGIADEALQYTWITISYSNYLDFNDFVLNLLGAAAGLLLHYGFAAGSQLRDPANTGPTPSSRKRRAKRAVIRDLDNLPLSAGGRGGVPDDSNVVRTKAGVGRGAVPDAQTPENPSATSGRPTQIHNTGGRGGVPDDSDVVRTKAGAGRLSPKGVSRRPETPQNVGLRSANPTYATSKTPVHHGLIGFAWLGTTMLLAIAALQTASTDPQLLQPIERQPSYNTWIPGPRAGRYYVLDPVTGTLILVGLGALASAAPAARPRT